jgi:O-methyltransferase domain/Dimerisation domain
MWSTSRRSSSRMPGEPPTVTLRRLVNGYQVTQAIHVAAVLGIADLLADGARSSDDLAAASGAHAPSLHRVLRALASIGVLHEADDGRFSLTEVGHCLRSDAPDPVGGWAAYVGGHAHFAAWGNLLQAVRTGESAFRSVHGADVWEYRARHPEDGARFDQAMTDNTRQTNRRLLEAYDFGPLRSVIDVGERPRRPARGTAVGQSADARRALRPSPRRGGRSGRRSAAARSSAGASSMRFRRAPMPTS